MRLDDPTVGLGGEASHNLVACLYKVVEPWRQLRERSGELGVLMDQQQQDRLDPCRSVL